MPGCAWWRAAASWQTGVSWYRADSVRAQVTVWFPAQFAELRRLCLADGSGEAAFAASLSRCHAWAARGGKSKSYFAKARSSAAMLVGGCCSNALFPS